MFCCKGSSIILTVLVVLLGKTSLEVTASDDYYGDDDDDYDDSVSEVYGRKGASGGRMGTRIWTMASEPTMDLFNKYLLSFGNYEGGIGTPCNFELESKFFKNLITLNKADFLDQTWKNDLMLEDLQSMCNRFKYLRCDKFSERCVCGVQNTFWSAYNQSMARRGIPGKCRVRMLIKNVCDNDTGVRWIFKQPFTSKVLPVEFNNSFTPEPVVNSTCLLEFGRMYTCQDGRQCKSGRSFLEKEFQKLRQQVDDSQWNFQPNYICNSSLIYALTRGGNTEFGYDFERIRKAINLNHTTEHCNPLSYKECRYGVCDCPVGRNGETDYTLLNNKCVVSEGGVCSRYYWFNGNWEIKFQACNEGLVCRPVDNNEQQDFSCCDPEKDKGNQGLGKCKLMLSSGLLIKNTNSIASILLRRRSSQLKLLTSAVLFLQL